MTRGPGAFYGPGDDRGMFSGLALSTEIRWIFPGVVPPEMLLWLSSVDLVDTADYIDYYQHPSPLPGELACKHRDRPDRSPFTGAKRLLEGLPACTTTAGIAGMSELWRKEPTDKPFATAWVPVLKRRHRTCKSYVTPGVEAFRIECTELVVAGSNWWSFASVARHRGDRTLPDVEALVQDMDARLATCPAASLLVMANSSSYPEWLAANTGHHTF